jgi:ABC-type lipoprotein export system ATPase subunit
MPEPLVRASRLQRTYRVGQTEAVAVRDATFEIHDGARIALVGPSGSGKTTILHLVAALDEPTAGSIEWPALGPAEQLRPGPVAVAFQGPSLLPPLTVSENVALPLLLLDVDAEEARDRARDLLGRFGLDDVADKLPEEISGGQSQRAGLARALAGRPRLLLADEPTGQQDGETGRAMMAALLEAAVDEGMALLVATHDARVAELLDTTWSIRDGSLDAGVVPSSR